MKTPSRQHSCECACFAEEALQLNQLENNPVELDNNPACGQKCGDVVW